ncbi:hypothetical protein HBH56_107170 [Parastagonospora nodorum]|uniref:RBR-type E3 ubiquitin transferase n=2 Tax=Phaeosphaeria nodorum (strain SN15 / ATCC MYA-4574 / FGSC 10173) TaxID=321614 RepID=A0A7U2FGK2_PHANO|nr:hypothetical protein SNOG_10805 [Parastagonospora nodorum SN15]KAH3913746.1 hypothetical protein HBH56_107170 [Parastagonospora nodorum]EAT82199.1 hypothetical protein SNOG_10805 [Parastagonospora nodorum SN15]KAH3929204.1 hypothetical protein HBH54_123250 [Parastagonospora nodorum]KAH3975555.1 hypothetical protein HBH52_129540 [Parastagonospora nodorum]KAH4067492.1 hypothetical protein HBH50_127910 [Parastagonospora nodorum]
MVSQRELQGLGPPPSLADSARLHPRERAEQRRQRIVEAALSRAPDAEDSVAETDVPEAVVQQAIIPPAVGSPVNEAGSLAPNLSLTNQPSIRIGKREFDSLDIATDAEDLPRAKRRARPVSSIAGPSRRVTRSAGVVQGSLVAPQPAAASAPLEAPPAPAPPVMRHCEACLEDFPTEEFPQLDGCQRGPNIHNLCFARWIAVRVGETTHHRNTTCPCGCGTVLTRENVEQYAEGNTLQGYDDLLAQELAEELGFRRCIGPDCESGQIHDSEDGNIFICHECGHRHCSTHDIPFHDGETCEDYDNRLHREAMPPTAEEIADQEYVDKHTKNCPGPKCGKRGDKVSGCDHMTCEQCQFEYCWRCLAPYAGPEGIRLRGNAAHAPNCPYYSENLPDHPQDRHNPAPVRRAYRTSMSIGTHNAYRAHKKGKK